MMKALHAKILESSRSFLFYFLAFLEDIILSKYKIYPDSLLDQYFRKLLNFGTVLP